MMRSVMREHAIEAATLSSIRRRGVHAPDYDLEALARLDERIEAHLDGLRIGGRAARVLAARAMDEGDAGELFVAAVLAFESQAAASSGTSPELERVLDAACAVPLGIDAAALALAWVPRARAVPVLARIATARAPALRHLAIAGYSAHGIDPGAPLRAALIDGDVSLRARALAAIGELGLVDLVDAAEVELDADEEACRIAAASSAALLGRTGAAFAVLGALASGRDGEEAEAIVRLAAWTAPPELGRAFAHDLERAGNMRAAAIAAGALGDPSLLDRLLTWLREPPLSRVAGEAIATITGLRIASGLATGAPAGFRSGPTDDPDDDDVAMDPDTGLSWPDVEAVTSAVRAMGPLAPGPLLLGQPRRGRWLIEVLRDGLSRERAVAARALVFETPGHPLFDIAGPAPRQRALITTMSLSKAG
jgi:uncharacterized protein (TIGR02270 family)